MGYLVGVYSSRCETALHVHAAPSPTTELYKAALAGCSAGFGPLDYRAAADWLAGCQELVVLVVLLAGWFCWRRTT